MVIIDNTTPVSTAHDELVLVVRAVGVLVEDWHLQMFRRRQYGENRSIEGTDIPLSRRYRSSASSDVSWSTTGLQERARLQEVYRGIIIRYELRLLMTY